MHFSDTCTHTHIIYTVYKGTMIDTLFMCIQRNVHWLPKDAVLCPLCCTVTLTNPVTELHIGSNFAVALYRHDAICTVPKQHN